MPKIKKILKLSEDHDYKVVEENLAEKINDSNPSPALQASEIGLILALPITLGALFGLWLDNKFGTQPRLMLSGLFTGVFISFSNLFLIVKQFSKKKNNKKNG